MLDWLKWTGDAKAGGIWLCEYARPSNFLTVAKTIGGYYGKKVFLSVSSRGISSGGGDY
jgi:hypothetical protein